MIYRFKVDGPLYGYRASVRRAFDPKYKAFKEKVHALAMEAGLFSASLNPKLQRVQLSVFVYWRKNPRIDWSNCFKAVEDALFRQDRWIHPGPNCGWQANGASLNEVAEVTVEIW